MRVPSAVDAETLHRLNQWVRDRWQPGIGRVQEISEDSDERRLLVDIAAKAFHDFGVPVSRLRTWLNFQPPDPGEGYSNGYPHVHQDLTATTLVLYLSENPSPLDILEDGEVTETLHPELGDLVFIPNGVWHGVHRTDIDRVALIATAYP